MTIKNLLWQLEVSMNEAMASGNIEALENMLLDIQYIKSLETDIKEYLREHKDSLNSYKVVVRKTYKILNQDYIMNKYPYEKYPDYYKVTLDTKKCLNTIPHEEVEYEEVVSESLVKNKKKEK